MGEYNAVADTLEIINDTIRFQGKSGGHLGRGRLLSGPQAWGLSEGQPLGVRGFVGKWGHPLLLTEHTYMGAGICMSAGSP